MTRTSFADWPCSMARTIEIVGDAWNVLILREVFYGVRRFDEIQGTLGISRNVLTKRLRTLVEQEILEKRLYQENPSRYRYVPTPKGIALFEVMMAMTRFGDDWLSPDGTMVYFRDRASGEPVKPRVVDEKTGQPIDYRRLIPSFGPGFPPERRDEPLSQQRFGGHEGW